MRHLSLKRLLLKLFPVVCISVLFLSGRTEALEFSWTPALSLPEISQDVFVSTHAEDWDFTVSGNHFTLQTPVIRPNFSRMEAGTIEKVVAVFAPAGGILSQSSQLYSVSGIWMLRIEGVLSRGTPDGIVLNSVEVIYRDNSAELVSLEKTLSLGSMNTPNETDSSGGCNGWFGLAALTLVGIFALKRSA